jgi:hypothetical protein
MDAGAQTLIAIALAVLAAGYLVRTAWRQVVSARKARNDCGSDCGCGH